MISNVFSKSFPLFPISSGHFFFELTVFQVSPLKKTALNANRLSRLISHATMFGNAQHGSSGTLPLARLIARAPPL
jgi:hypothetical protein